jgi:hypothetical protein
MRCWRFSSFSYEKSLKFQKGVLDMEVNGENYRVAYDSATATITCQGSLRLYGATGYASVVELLNTAADQKPPILTLNLEELQFLNSSGINAFSKFVIRVRNHKASQLVVRGTQQFPWQSKSLRNLQRLMPDLKLEL